MGEHRSAPVLVGATLGLFLGLVVGGALVQLLGLGPIFWILLLVAGAAVGAYVGRTRRGDQKAMIRQESRRGGPPWRSVGLALLCLSPLVVFYGIGVAWSTEYGAVSGFGGDPRALSPGPATMTIEDANGKVYVFTGTRQQVADWRERMFDKLDSDLAVPEYRSRLGSTALTIFWTGVALALVGLGVVVTDLFVRVRQRHILER